MLKGREDLFHPSVMNIVLLVPNDCLHILIIFVDFTKSNKAVDNRESPNIY